MEIGHTGVVTPVNILADSRGGTNYTQEKIVVNGKNESLRSRGYNFVVLDPDSGMIEEKRNFDTWGERGLGSQKIADFVNGIPEGKIVVATVRDEAGLFLYDDARDALKQLGVTHSPGKWWAHAFIGVKGSTSGTALEVISQDRPAVVGVLKNDLVPFKSPVDIEQALIDSLQAHPEAPVAIYLGDQISESLLAIRHIQSLTSR